MDDADDDDLTGVASDTFGVKSCRITELTESLAAPLNQASTIAFLAVERRRTRSNSRPTAALRYQIACMLVSCAVNSVQESPRDSRICSAVLVQTNGFGSSFHSLAQNAGLPDLAENRLTVTTTGADKGANPAAKLAHWLREWLPGLIRSMT
ncbi:hypothetical protein ABH903_001390 [Brevibacterium epidermidis]|uniref:Uncharacterized protein n=1 Tax=Brevibacterium epidermidis TaxID=1698 RepID=A0ABV4EJ89_BREEP